MQGGKRFAGGSVPGIRDATGSEVDIARAVSIWQQHWANKSQQAKAEAASISTESHHQYHFKNLLADAEARIHKLKCAQLDKDGGKGTTFKALRLAEQSLQIWGQDVGEPLPPEWLLSAVLLLNLFAAFRRKTDALHSAGAYLRKCLLLEHKLLEAVQARMNTILRKEAGSPGFEKKKHGAFLFWVEVCFLLARTRLNISAVAGELGRQRVAFSHSLCAIRLITWGLLGPPVDEEGSATGDGSSSATDNVQLADGDESESEDGSGTPHTGRSRRTVTWENLADEDLGIDDDEEESESEEDEDPDYYTEKEEEDAGVQSGDPQWYSSARLRSSLLAGTLLKPAQSVVRPELAAVEVNDSESCMNLGALHEPAVELLVAALLAIAGASEHLDKISLALQAYRSASQVEGGLPPKHPLKMMSAIALEEVHQYKVSRHPTSPEDSDDDESDDGVKVVSETSSGESNGEGDEADNWKHLKELALRKSFVNPGRSVHAMKTALRGLKPGDQRKVQCMELLRKAKQGVIDRFELLGIVALRRLEFSLVQRYHSLTRAFKALDSNCKGSLSYDEWVEAFERAYIPGAPPEIAKFAYDYILRFSPIKGAGTIEMRRTAMMILEQDLCSFCGHMSRCWKWLPADSWSFCTEVDSLLRTLRKRLLEIYDDVHQAFSEMGWEGEHMITDLEFRSAIPFWNIKGFSETDAQFLFEALDIDSKGSISYMELEFFLRKQALDDTARRGLKKHVLQSLNDFRKRTIARFGSLEKAVKIMDTNRDHIVDEDEFRKAMERYDLPQAEITELWKAIDFNSLGKIDSQELLKFLHHIGTDQETNECVAEIAATKASETTGARRAWIPGMTDSVKLQNQTRRPGSHAAMMANRLKRTIDERAGRDKSDDFLVSPEEKRQKEKDLRLSLASQAAVRRGEIDEPWLRAALEHMHFMVHTDKVDQVDRYGDDAFELRELRERHFNSVRKISKKAQQMAEEAVEQRPTRPWSAAMDKRELEKKQVAKHSSELKKVLRERDPAVRRMRSLTKEARNLFGGEKKEEGKRVLFQKKAHMAGSAHPAVSARFSFMGRSSFAGSSGSIDATAASVAMEDAIELTLKKTFARAATAIEEKDDFINSAKQPEERASAILRKQRHIPDKAAARRNLGEMSKAMQFVSKMKRASRNSAILRELTKSKERDEEADDSEGNDPGPEVTAELARELRAGLAGNLHDREISPLKVHDRVGPYSPSKREDKRNTAAASRSTSMGVLLKGGKASGGLKAAMRKQKSTDTLSQLAQSVNLSASKDRKPPRMFELSFLPYEGKTVENLFDTEPSNVRPMLFVDQTLTDDSPATAASTATTHNRFGKSITSPTESSSPSKLMVSQRPVTVNFNAFTKKASETPSNKAQSRSSTLSKPTKEMDSTKSMPMMAMASISSSKARFEFWNEDSQNANPASPSRRRKSMAAPKVKQDDGESSQGSSSSSAAKSSNLGRNVLLKPPPKTQNIIGIVKENIFESDHRMSVELSTNKM